MITVLYYAYCAITNTFSVLKRNNEYGDEVVTPSAEAVTAEAPATMEEETAPTVEQPAPSAAPVESSGYRKRRGNEYGDEPITPSVAPAAAPGVSEEYGPTGTPPEEEPSIAKQPPPPQSHPSVQSSGYRNRRNNEYGDEPVVPAAGPPVDAYAPPELAPEPAVQPLVPPPVPVESSGYRLKRNINSGDKMFHATK